MTPRTPSTTRPRRPNFTIEPSGTFSLAEAAAFGFGQRDAAVDRGVMRLAFCVDGYQGHAAVEVRQDAAGVHGWAQGEADPATVRDQVARVLSLDHDGEAFAAVGRRDPVIARLQAVAPGLRPPLFYSPYEAAAWAVLSARRPAAQMARVRQRLNEAHGRTFEIAGEAQAAFPTPAQLLEVREMAGVPDVKLRRLHRVALAALDGHLDAAALREAGVDEGRRRLQRLEGIGPFYASLIMIRASGLADVLPTDEPKLTALVMQLYALERAPGPAELGTIAEPWRPLRTWAAVLIRAATARLATPTAPLPQ